MRLSEWGRNLRAKHKQIAGFVLGYSQMRQDSLLELVFLIYEMSIFFFFYKQRLFIQSLLYKEVNKCLLCLTMSNM